MTATTQPPQDTTAPSVPTSVTATATGPDTVEVAWTASTDDVGVTGYHVYRDGSSTPQATVTSGTSFLDIGLVGGTSHSYTVSAFDGAENESAEASPPITVTTDPPVVLAPIADAYVDASEGNNNFGTATDLEIDGAPTMVTYMKFDVSGITGTVTDAKLLLWTSTSDATGFEVFGVSDTSWSESNVTYQSAPAYGSTAVGSSGPITAGSWTTVDVTSLVTGNGLISIAIATSSNSPLTFSSREGSDPPQLVITEHSGLDTTAPSVPTSLAASGVTANEVGLSWTASTDDMGVVGYHIYRDGSSTPVATVIGTSYRDSGLNSGTTYIYTVAAFDAVGNESPESSPPVSETTGLVP